MTGNMVSNKPVKQNLKTKHQIFWLISILLLISIASIIARVLIFSPEKLAADDQLWRLTIQVETTKTDEPARLKINPPFDTRYIRTIERNISHPGFKIKNTTTEKNSRRSIYAIANTKQALVISADFLLHKSSTPFNLTTTKTTELSTEQRASYLSDDENFEIFSYAIQKQLNQIKSQQPIQELMTKEIYSRLKKIPVSTKASVYNVSKILTLNKATTLDRSLAMVALCRAAGIPARLVSGLIIKQNNNPTPHYWVQVYENSQWNAYDIHYGYELNIPNNYLPLRYNNTEIMETLTGKIKDIKYGLTPEFNHPFLNSSQKKSVINIFDFSRLSIDDRNQMALLLLLPLGALVTALFRHLIGISSYGVFTPTLLALAIVYADLITTLIVFIVVSSLAIGGRSFFPSAITRTPRLSIIFTLIALIMAFSVSTLSYLGFSQNDSVILLPIIILTSLVDRFYRTIEESGITIAIRRLIWTIIITLTCLPIIQFETLGHLLLQYPEAHFTTLALFLLVSTYKGKHFINLPLIKFLAEPDPKKRNKEKSDSDI